MCDLICTIFVSVGPPIDVEKIEKPTNEQVNFYHEKFVKHMKTIFEEHKHKYIPNADKVELVFVDEWVQKKMYYIYKFVICYWILLCIENMCIFSNF